MSRMLSALFALTLLLPAAASATCLPVHVADATTGGAAVEVAVAGDLAVVAASTAGIVTVDLGSGVATRPKLGNSATLNAVAVDVDGSLAAIADSENGIVLFDVSDPAHPVRLGSAPTDDVAAGVDLSGDFLAVAAKSAGLLLFDVSNPAAPVRLSKTMTSGFARGVVLSGNVAYVAAWSGGLDVFEVSSSASPTKLATAPVVSRAVGVFIVGSTLYLAARTDGLRIFDVSSPGSPVLRSVFDMSGQSVAVTVRDGIAYVANLEGGLDVLDVRVDTAPVKLAHVSTRNYASGVALHGNELVVAEWDGTLELFDVSACIPVQLDPPVAAFTISDDTPDVGQAITFEDHSTGEVTSRSWLFADGATSSGAVVTRSFPTSGLSTARLTVANAAGESSTVRSFEVHCPLPCAENPVLVLPGAAHSPGLSGTTWRSDLDLHNPSESGDLDLAIEFRPRAETGGGAANAAASLPSGGSERIRDVVHTLFGRDGDSGTLRIVAIGGETPLAALSTSNDAATGEFGQGIPAELDVDPKWTAPVLEVFGLREDSSFRSNLFLENLGEVPLRVRLEILASNGRASGSRTVDLPAIGNTQVALASFFVPEDAARQPLAVVATRESGTAFLLAASRIDNRTGDPTFHVAAPIDAAAGSPLVLPGAADAPGVSDTSWKTRILVRNRGSEPVSLPLRYAPSSGGGGLSATLDLAAFEGIELDDCTANLFGAVRPTWGRIVAEPPAASAVDFAIETYDDAPDGTFGQAIGASSLTGFLTASPGAVPQRIVGVVSDDTFRTNIGATNLGDSAATVRLRLVLGDGTVFGERNLTLGGGESYQLEVKKLFGWNGAPLEASTVLADPVSGGPVPVWGSRVDNGSGDPVFLPAIFR